MRQHIQLSKRESLTLQISFAKCIDYRPFSARVPQAEGPLRQCIGQIKDSQVRSTKLEIQDTGNDIPFHQNIGLIIIPMNDLLGQRMVKRWSGGLCVLQKRMDLLLFFSAQR